jgi:hypothetical protein
MPCCGTILLLIDVDGLRCYLLLLCNLVIVVTFCCYVGCCCGIRDLMRAVRMQFVTIGDALLIIDVILLLLIVTVDIVVTDTFDDDARF